MLPSSVTSSLSNSSSTPSTSLPPSSPLTLPISSHVNSIPSFFPKSSSPSISSSSSPSPSSSTTTTSLPSSSHNFNSLKFLLCGAVAGAVSRTCTAPLDRLKIHLQTSIHPSPLTLPWFQYPKWVFTSLQDALSQLYRLGGLRSFWRGNGMNCLKIVPESGTKFMVFETMKLHFSHSSSSSSCSPSSLSSWHVFWSGAMAGICSQALVYPLETLKIQWMAHPTSHLRTQMKTLYRTYGLQGFFRGFTVSLIGIVPYAGLDLGVFDLLKRSYQAHLLTTTSTTTTTTTSSSLSSTSSSPTLTGTQVLGLGIVSGCVACTLVYPLSLVRTRLQAQGTIAHPRMYHGGFWQVVKLTYQRESMLGFYKGWLPTLMKVAPATGITFFCYEKTKNWIL